MALYADPSYVPNQALFVRSYSQRQLKALPQSTQDVENLWTTFSISSFCTSPPIRYTPYFICDEPNLARTVRMLADLLRADNEYEAQCAFCGFDIAIIVSEFFLLGMQNPSASLTAVKAIKDLRVRSLYDAMRRIGMTVFREVWKKLITPAQPQNTAAGVFFSQPSFMQLVHRLESDSVHEEICCSAMIGALFQHNIATSDDLHLCIELLLFKFNTRTAAAIYTIIMYAGDKMCKNQNSAYMNKFRHTLWLQMSQCRSYEMYCWMRDICDIIDAFFSAQAYKKIPDAKS